MYIKKSPYLCGTKTEMMEVNEVKKKLGRPKNGSKGVNDGGLLHVVLSPESHAVMKKLLLLCRVMKYNFNEHGPMPKNLPRANNLEAVEKCFQLIASHNYLDTDKYLYYLRVNGCLNGHELLGIEEEPEQ